MHIGFELQNVARAILLDSFYYHSFLADLRDPNEMTQKSHTWERSATSWGAHSAEEDLADNCGKLKVLIVVETV